MKRRDFVLGLAAGALASHVARAAEPLRDLKITRVVGFDLVCRRSKVAGKNSHLDVHGDRATDRMLRIFTNQQLEGIGNLAVGREAAAALLGKSVAELFVADERRMTGPLGVGTLPLWDLVGKALDQPVYQLLGGAGPERVGVYDGSIYFADLLPMYQSRWEDRLREEIDMARQLGHQAVKVKVGRGFKWMPRAAGDRRDIDVLQLIRRHAGDDFTIGIDANNGYDLAGTRRLFEQVGDLKIAFAEEMFPEKVDDCLAFKEFLHEHDWDTLVADGETQGDLAVFRPFVAAKAIDVFQADMKRFGIEGIMAEAQMAGEQNLRVAPHNWGSWIGYFMQLHVGRAIKNFYRAEHDPLSTDLLVADGYSISAGEATLPDAPGLGLQIDDAHFADAKIHFDVRL
ncbi:MAG: enolase C-terminal domain-like protein [Pirellulales bacterium]